jgi:predicted amidohydrolase
MPKVTVALVQFDALPEQAEHNLEQMERLARQAVGAGARWVMFHESALTDYSPRVQELAQKAPDGPACERMIALSRQLGCWLNFGMSEADDGRYYITQVFTGPEGYFYHYRKTWLFRKDTDDPGYRNEWAYYDPGDGPVAFEHDGVRATCFICADSASARCRQRIRALKPQVVFHPLNVRNGMDQAKVRQLSGYAANFGAPMLVANRVGSSWGTDCMGGSTVFSASGEVLARANRENREEVLIHELSLPEAV